MIKINPKPPNSQKNIDHFFRMKVKIFFKFFCEKKFLLQLTGNRNPRPTEQRVVSDSVEQRVSPAVAEVPLVVESHVQALGEGPPP